MIAAAEFPRPEGHPLLDRLAQLGVPLMDLTADSRTVKLASIFVAYPGTSQDGRMYIADAISRGAAAVLWEREGFTWNERLGGPEPRRGGPAREDLRHRGRDLRQSVADAVDGGRDGHQRQDLGFAMDRRLARCAGAALGRDRNAGQRPGGRAGRGEEHHARSHRAAAPARRLPAPRRAQRRDGSLEPWHGPGARRGHQVRRRGVHEPHARPPRLPRHHGVLRRGQVQALLGARPHASRREHRRQLGCGARVAVGARRDHLWHDRQAATFARAAWGFRKRACVSMPIPNGATAKCMPRVLGAFNVVEPPRGDGGAARRGRELRRRRRRGELVEARARPPRAPGRRRGAARGRRLRAHARCAREGARGPAPDAGGGPSPLLRIRLRRGSRPGQASAHGACGGEARRPCDRHERQPAQRRPEQPSSPRCSRESRCPRRRSRIARSRSSRPCTRRSPATWCCVAGKGHETYQEIAGVRHAFDDREVARAALHDWERSAG